MERQVDGMKGVMINFAAELKQIIKPSMPSMTASYIWGEGAKGSA